MQQLEAKRCFQTRGLGCRVYGEPRQSRQGVAAALRRLLARPCNMPAPSQASRSLPQPAPALSAVREQTTVDWCHAKNTVKETEAPADLLLAPPVSLGKRQACASVPQDMLLSGDRLRHLPLRTDLDFIVDAAQVELFQVQLLGAGRSSKVFKGRYKNPWPLLQVLGLKRVHNIQPIAGSSDLFVGTLQCMAPECFSTQTGKVTAPADVFSAAVVVAEMLNHAPPWQGCHPMGVVFQLVFLGRRPHISDRHCPTSLRQLLLSCMRRQPCECPSTVEVLEQQQCIGDGLGSPKYAGN